MRFDVLVNEGGGSIDRQRLDDELRAIESAFAAAGAEATARVVPPARMTDEIRRCWAATSRPDAVLVAGGDGTVSVAAQAAAGTDIVVGVVPLGTFNHFAKDLGTPVELEEAAVALVGGAARAVDVAEVNGRAFVNNSALGLYPDLVAVRDRLRDRHGWGKVRAVPVAAFQVLRRFPMHRLDVVGPGYERLRVRTPLVFVGNGVFHGAPGRLPERRDLADGALGVAVARVVSRWDALRLAARTLVRGRADRDLDAVALTELEVRAHVRHLRVAVDGEICTLVPPLRYRVLPAALQVWSPATPPSPTS